MHKITRPALFIMFWMFFLTSYSWAQINKMPATKVHATLDKEFRKKVDYQLALPTIESQKVKSSSPAGSIRKGFSKYVRDLSISFVNHIPIVDVFIKVKDLHLVKQNNLVEITGIYEGTNINIVTAKVDISDLVNLARDENIEFIEASKRLYPLLETSTSFVGASQVWNLSGVNNPNKTINGKNVYMGIIEEDTLRWSHHTFSSTDDLFNNRIKAMWLESNDGIYEQGNFPIPLNYDYHATHVTGIAAGDGWVPDHADLKGVAHGSEILFGSVFFPTQVPQCFRWMIEKATTDSLPLVVNMSLGKPLGPHDGNTLFEATLNHLIDSSGVSLVVASGNDSKVSSPYPHFQGTVPGNPGEFLEIEFQVESYAFQNGNNQTVVEFWFDGEIDIQVGDKDPFFTNWSDIVTFDTDTVYKFFDWDLVGDDTIFVFNYGSNNYGYGWPNTDTSNVIAIYYDGGTDNYVDGGTYKIRLYPSMQNSGGTVNAYHDRQYKQGVLTNPYRGFVDGDNFQSLYVPATAENVISIGASKNELNGDIADFSGLGPLRSDNAITVSKPDLTAPGAPIISSGISSDTDILNLQGTSMAAPHVAGAIALLLQSFPELTASQIKSLLKDNAAEIPDQQGGTKPPGLEDNKYWGAGKLDILAVYEAMIGFTYNMPFLYQDKFQDAFTTHPYLTGIPIEPVQMMDADLYKQDLTNGGIIYQPTNTNAFWLGEGIWNYWAYDLNGLTTVPLIGYPVSSEYLDANNNNYPTVNFQNGSIFWDGSQAIEVYINITAEFQALPLSGNAPLTIQFTDNSTTQNTSITSWQWDFNNDGITDSEEQNPTRFFGTPGSYTVSLTVSDGSISDTETKTNYITVNPEILPNTTQIEYFFDSDPGFGNGTALPISAGNEVTVQATLDVSALSTGLHRLYVRAKDEDGQWGIPQAKTVLIQATDADDPLPDVSDVEYFMDNDPGQGSGTPFSITPGTTVNIADNLDLSATPTGLHRLYVRAKHDNGAWGIPQARSLLVQATDADDPLPEVSAVEYFLDADPGVGAATPISMTPGTEVEINDNLDLSATAPGLHRVYVRAKDEDAQWGIPQSKTVFVQQTSPADPLPNITQVEYFFDADPGIGAGSSLSFTPDDTVEIAATLPLNTLPLGDHSVYVRAQNSNSLWGIPQFHTFSVVEFLVFTDTEAAVLGAPVYFNEGGDDPGDGHAIDMSFGSLSGSGNVTVRQTNQTPANLLNNAILNYTWDITKEAGISAFTIDMTFHYQDYDLSGVSESQLVAAYYDETLPGWSILTDFTRDAANNTITVHNLDHFATFAVGEPGAFQLPATVDLKVFLEGPYAAGAMFTNLLNSGFIPLAQPFSGAPWHYPGTESVSAVPADVVDWVLIELRSDITANSAVAFRAAFLKSDGSIVDLDGGIPAGPAGGIAAQTIAGGEPPLFTEIAAGKRADKIAAKSQGLKKSEGRQEHTPPPENPENSASPVKFDIPAGDYYICIHHRNHLSVMSAAVHAINPASTLYDFSASLAAAYTGGGIAMKDLGGGVYGLFAADATGDGQVTSSDFNVFLPAARTAQTGYLLADWNLDGQVTSTDFNIFNPNARNAAKTQVPGSVLTGRLRIKNPGIKEEHHEQ
ncbi:MAG: S8 family serine peptidase [Calditrichae bacterium]|nr:S8 family serine peptidase [Calditrichia bacterium]